MTMTNTSARADIVSYHLKINDASVDGITGHHTIHVHIEEVYTNPQGEEISVVTGVPETYGIEATALQSRFAGDEQAWIKWVADEMIRKHLIRKSIQHRLLQMRGQRVPADIPLDIPADIPAK